MAMLDRIKGILLEPKNEWVKIAAESTTAQNLYTGWIMILAAIGPIAILLSWKSVPFAIGNYVTSLIITFIIALIVDNLAPSFGGTKDFVASLKLTAYSYTAAWLAGIFHLLGHLGGVAILIASIYAWYTFFLGAPILRRCTADKAIQFTIVIVLCGVVLVRVPGPVLAEVRHLSETRLPLDLDQLEPLEERPVPGDR